MLSGCKRWHLKKKPDQQNEESFSQMPCLALLPACLPTRSLFTQSIQVQVLLYILTSAERRNWFVWVSLVIYKACIHLKKKTWRAMESYLSGCTALLPGLLPMRKTRKCFKARCSGRRGRSGSALLSPPPPSHFFPAAPLYVETQDFIRESCPPLPCFSRLDQLPETGRKHCTSAPFRGGGCQQDLLQQCHPVASTCR